MMRGPMLETERLILRRWRDADRAPFAALNDDLDVMEFMPKRLDRATSDAWVERCEAAFEERGFGLWAVEVRATGRFAGFVGLQPPSFEAHFTPCVEVGWRLARESWGSGFATEGARAAVAFGFDEVGLDEIVSFTVPANVRSRRVMEKLGMTRDPSEDFDHPKLEAGHPLQRHVLYRLARPR